MNFLLFFQIFLSCITAEVPPWRRKNSKFPFLNLPTPKVDKITHIDKSFGYRDKLGRERYFRGLNVVYKGIPYYPLIQEYDRRLSFNQDDIEFLAFLNVNVIRLGIMWPGVEPERGTYNQTYIEQMKKIFDMCLEKVFRCINNREYTY
jgi:hypothetical protein